MIIVFDMDGTVADLYGVENWLPKLRNEDPTPYAEAKPLWDMDELNAVLNELRNAGHYINVVSWLSKNSTEAYKVKVRKAKREWLAEHMPTDFCHLVQYGTPKARVIAKYAETTEAILIDDEARNREAWNLGRTIDPTSCDLIETLRGLL